MSGRDAPRVGQRVRDTATDRDAIVTDVRRQGVPRPVYVLRPDGVVTSRTWETTTPGHLQSRDGEQ